MPLHSLRKGEVANCCDMWKSRQPEKASLVGSFDTGEKTETQDGRFLHSP